MLKKLKTGLICLIIGEIIDYFTRYAPPIHSLGTTL